MSSFKPRRVASAELFHDDYREQEKYFHLDPVIQPVVGIRDGGGLHSFGMPLEDIVITTEVGNVGIAAWPDEFEDGQIWVLDTFTIVSVLGADYTGIVDGIPTGNTVTVAALASGDLLGNSFYFDAQLGVGVTNGAAADNFFLRGRRVA